MMLVWAVVVVVYLRISLVHAVTDEKAAIKVTVLGSGTPSYDPVRNAASVLIEAGDEVLLFDCGRACTSRLVEYNRTLLNRVDKLFVTHLHSDHTTGIPDLWLGPWAIGRDSPLRVWGPTGTTAMMDGLRIAFAEDIRVRVVDENRTLDGISRAFTEFTLDGVVYESENDVRVSSFLVNHGPVVRPAYGFVVEYAGHKVVLSGDTTITDSLVKHAHGAQVLLLNLIDMHSMEVIRRIAESPTVFRAITRRNLNVGTAVRVMRFSRPGLVVFYHTGPSNEETVTRIQKLYDGRFIISADLTQVLVSNRSGSNDGVSVRYVGSSCAMESRHAALRDESLKSALDLIQSFHRFTWPFWRILRPVW